MTQQITEVMSTDLAILQSSDSVTAAAQYMHDRNVGAVLVMDGDEACGVITDRDIVMRVVASGSSADSTSLNEICTHELVTLDATSSVEDAMEVMRQHAIRRVPVLDHNHPIGMVSLGDLAIARDRQSVLGAVSAASPNS